MMVTPGDYVLDPRFSRTFELPAGPASNGRTGPFKVKYADYGYRNEAHPEQENVLLFFGPLMASRLFHIAKDELAKKRKIRIINLDRPGIGGTDPADAKDRMGLWLGMVPSFSAPVNALRFVLTEVPEQMSSPPSSPTSASATSPSPATAAAPSGPSTSSSTTPNSCTRPARTSPSAGHGSCPRTPAH